MDCLHPPRYNRPVEWVSPQAPRKLIPPERHEAAIAASDLTIGARELLRGLMRMGGIVTFPGGGVGLDYACLLKNAVRPDILGGHVAEAAAVLRDARVDLLIVPGMSGYPIGTMYAMAAGIPALLLRKEPWHAADGGRRLPPGAFVLPSYTGSGEVLMTADPAALVDVTRAIFARQAARHDGNGAVELSLRVAGADDIIDKATMARAVADSVPHLGRFALQVFEQERPPGGVEVSGLDCRMVTLFTPLIKAYNQPERQIAGLVESAPFAGLRITGLYTEPNAIGIEGVGVLAFG